MSRALAIVAMVALLAGSVLYFVRANSAGAPSSTPTAQSGPVSVTVDDVVRREVRHTLNLIGTVRAGRQAGLSAKVPSRIAAVLVRDGQHVRQGEVLVKLDVGDTTALLAGADAGVAAAQAQYRKAVEGKRARLIELDGNIMMAETGLKVARAKLKQAELGVPLTDTAAVSDRDRAQAGVLQAEAGVRQAEAGYKQASDMVERLEKLYKKGGIAQADLEAARTQAEIAKGALDTARAGLAQAHAAAKPAADAAPLRTKVSQADVEAARAGVAQAEDGVAAAKKAKTLAIQIAERDVEAARAMVEQARAGVTQARAQVGGSFIASPMDGIATEVTAKSGEYAQPGMTIATVVAPEALTIEVAVSARYAAMLRPGAAARILADQAPETPIEAAVSEVLPVANADSRTFTVRIALPKGAPRLAVGSLAKVTIDVQTSPAAVSVPVDALRNEGNTTYVWVVADGKAMRKNVELGPTEGDHVEILSGLRVGEQVVVTGAATLSTGTPVSAARRR